MLRVWEGIADGSGNIKNTANTFIYIYANGTSITLTDGSGKTVKTTSTPCWFFPSWTVGGLVSGDRLYGLQSDNIQEFAGFLSRNPAGAVLPVVYLGATIGIKTLGIAAVESEIVANASGHAFSYTETETVTHT